MFFPPAPPRLSVFGSGFYVGFFSIPVVTFVFLVRVPRTYIGLVVFTTG